MFGDGSDGAITFTTSTQFDPPVDAAVVSGAMGGTALTVSSPSGVFLAGQRILIHQTQGAGAGQWELNTVSSYALGNIFTVDPLGHAYAAGGQVLVVPEFASLTVNTGVTVNAKPWNGLTGGILAFYVSGGASIDGTLSASGTDGINSSAGGLTPGAVGGGFRGGAAMRIDSPNTAYQGEGVPGAGSASTAANGNGGGGGGRPNNLGSGGGGGGNGSPGATGTADGGDVGGTGGGTAGQTTLATMSFGGGGGGGEQDDAPTSVGTGGSGGGIVVLAASTLTMTGAVRANGGNGGAVTSELANGGGGAGGSILLRSHTMTLGTASITAVGGSGGNSSGNGGVGRIRAEFCNSISGGFADPPASIQQAPAGDVDGDCFEDTTQTLHIGPNNNDGAKDNCPLAANPDQANADGNFIDNTPPTSQDDKTWPNSDAAGDACDSDDDNDGISDADEATGAACGGKVTDPLLRDTDGDRVLDGAECALGTDPTSNASKPTQAQCGPNVDADGDKLKDWTEFCGYNTSDASTDSDGDLALDGSYDGCEAASLNGDRKVNSGDQLLMVFEILREPSPSLRLISYDINKDGAVNAGDQLLIAQFIATAGQCP